MPGNKLQGISDVGFASKPYKNNGYVGCKPKKIGDHKI